ncbi:MAG: hypothetical protein NC319_06155 [Butyricicoccus sp.]|nr:hypothetical protein [Butyricicoccus sp.]
MLAAPPPFYSVRTGEALRLATEKLDQKNVYMINPAFDSAPGQAKTRRGS